MNTTLTADGNTSVFTLAGHLQNPNAGRVRIKVAGTFGSGTFKLQEKCEDGTWRDVVGSSVTSDADETFDFFKPGTELRGNLSGASSPSLYVQFN